MSAPPKTAEEVMERGREAQALLEHPTFVTVFTHLAEETQAEWRRTASGSTSLREQLFFQIHGLDAIKAQLLGWIDEAAFARQQIEKARERADKEAARRSPFSRP